MNDLWVFLEALSLQNEGANSKQALDLVCSGLASSFFFLKKKGKDINTHTKEVSNDEKECPMHKSRAQSSIEGVKWGKKRLQREIDRQRFDAGQEVWEMSFALFGR